MRINIWGNECGTFTVLIGNDVYEMSSDAHMPNGVNTYSGEARDEKHYNLHTRGGHYVGDIPLGLAKAIANRAASQWKDIADAYEDAFQDISKARMRVSSEFSVTSCVPK